MHQPRPFALFVENGELSKDDLSFIQHTVQKFTNYKQVNELDSLKRVYDLPDGGTAIMQDMGGTLRVIVDKPLSEIQPLSTKYKIPMILSGVIQRPIIKDDSNISLKATTTTRRRLIGYDPNKSMPPQTLEFRKLAVEYDYQFKYFEPRYKGIMLYTQYHKLLPTWYSGAMASVVQVIAGYGRPLSDDDKPTDWDKKLYILPDDVSKKIDIEIEQYILGPSKGVPYNEGKISYSYGAKTHAVGFSSNQCFLIEVSSSGVYVMPLPVIPATTSPTFREWVERHNDDEMIAIIDKFGGLPTGELMPVGEHREAWIRAGYIQRLCDTAEFYKHSLYYDACGWSFNSRASEGFNTCWSFDDSGMRWSYGFKLSLKLVDIDYEVSLSRDDEELKAKILAALDGEGEELKAIRYKINRLSGAELQAYQYFNFDQWNELKLEPKKKHIGSMAQTTKGRVYWWSKDKPQSFGYLKFPTLNGDGCQSFDMTMPDYKGGFVKCDTVVFGCYVDDSLKVVKYFCDESKFYKDKESTFEDYMIIGEWEETTFSGNSQIMGYLYTTDFDDRRAVSESEAYTKITGKDLGYGQPAYQTPAILYMWGDLSRARYYSQKTIKTVKGGDNLSIGICVPVLCRDSILYAFTESYNSSSYYEEVARKSVADPVSYGIWTYDPIFHWMGNSNNAIGSPSPTVGEYVYATRDSEPVLKTPYDEYAYSGDWFGVSVGSYKDVSGVCAKYTYRHSPYSGNATGVIIGGEAPQINEYTINKRTNGESKGKVCIAIHDVGAVKVHQNNPDPWYFSYSPVDSGGELIYFYRDATFNAFGIGYASTSEKKDEKARTHWGESLLVDNTIRPYFIGVVNE